MANQYKCPYCGMIVTCDYSPNEKMGGPCPVRAGGNHSWMQI